MSDFFNLKIQASRSAQNLMSKIWPIGVLVCAVLIIASIFFNVMLFLGVFLPEDNTRDLMATLISAIPIVVVGVAFAGLIFILEVTGLALSVKNKLAWYMFWFFYVIGSLTNVGGMWITGHLSFDWRLLAAFVFGPIMEISPILGVELILTAGKMESNGTEPLQPRATNVRGSDLEAQVIHVGAPHPEGNSNSGYGKGGCHWQYEDGRCCDYPAGLGQEYCQGHLNSIRRGNVRSLTA